jgi:hypothetical protein
MFASDESINTTRSNCRFPEMAVWAIEESRWGITCSPVENVACVSMLNGVAHVTGGVWLVA